MSEAKNWLIPWTNFCVDSAGLRGSSALQVPYALQPRIQLVVVCVCSV